MKAILIIPILLAVAATALAGSTINPTNRYAWGANVGWIDFRADGTNGVAIGEGVCSGSLYAANVGWISLSNVFAWVQTDTLVPGLDTDGDGISDVYELRWTGNLTTMNAATDQDGDGASDLDESLADTNPLDPMDQLRIMVITVTNRGEQTELTWTSQPTREYQIQTRPGLDVDSLWLNSVLGLQSPDTGTTTTRTIPGSAEPKHFYRIQAVPPLSP